MGMEYTPRKIGNIRKARKRQERRWAARSGPVVIIRPADPEPPEEPTPQR